MFRISLFTLLCLFIILPAATGCSILYYIDAATGKIYAVSNEDYWYNVTPFIKVNPRSSTQLARLWLGWNNFGQAGINEAGLFIDGATTPKEPAIPGYKKPQGNLTDNILAQCKTVNEALAYLEQNKVALTDGHLLLGDSTGNATVVEWAGGKRNLIPVADNKLMITNFLLTDTAKGNYPCPRYNAMEAAITQLRRQQGGTGMKEVAGVLAKAVQPPARNADGKEGGTLYSVFANISDMQLIVVYKLNNSKKIMLDLKKEFAATEEHIINME